MPFLPRYTPDYSRLTSIYQRGGEQLAELSLRRGATTAATLDRLASIFSGYQEIERQKQATTAATTRRAQERAEDRGEKQTDRDERAAERTADAERLQRQEDRAAARWQVDNTTPGTYSAIEAELALRFPETAARFSKQTTLPARPTPGTMGAMSQAPTDTGLVTLHPNAADARAAEQMAAQRARWAVEDTARGVDDDRQARALEATIAHQEATHRIAQQNAHATAATARARLGGEASALPAAYRNVLERVISTLPANRRGPKLTHAQRLFDEANEPELKDFIRQNAIEHENVDTKNQVLGRMATMASLKDAMAILRELQAKGVNTNIMRGTAEDVLRALGTTTNPELVSLRNRLAGTLINYRRAATGVAFGEREAAQYEQMFPNYKNTLPVNEALINGLMREMETYDRVYWEHKLGTDGAALILGAPPGAVPGATPPPPAGGGGRRLRFDRNGRPIP